MDNLEKVAKAFDTGFMMKCAEYGIEPNMAYRMLTKQSGDSMIKTAVDKGFFDRCVQRGITDVNQIQYLAKVAGDLVAMQKQSFEMKDIEEWWNRQDPLHRDMAIGGLVGAGAGSALGGLTGGVPGAIGGGLGGGLLGAGGMYGYHKMYPGKPKQENKQEKEPVPKSK